MNSFSLVCRRLVASKALPISSLRVAPLVVVLACGLVAAGCASDDSNAGPTESDLSISSRDGGTNCGQGVYPCGPYGFNKGDTVANLSFLGFQDPNDLCSDHRDKKLPVSSKPQKIDLAQWYVGSKKCGVKRKLLWINVSAGWCGPCRQEVTELSKQYNDGKLPASMDFYNIVFENDTRNVAATIDFVKTWIKHFDLRWPTVIDPEFKMGEYFNKNATPFNMLVDTKTMKIIYRTVGAQTAAIKSQVQQFLQK